jgi:dolichyl-phosphate-mannose--protein O-mannosyl transferase
LLMVHHTKTIISKNKYEISCYLTRYSGTTTPPRQPKIAKK